MTEVSEMMEVAVKAAKGAGAIAMKYFKEDKEEKEKTTDEVNYVTKADTESEQLIVDMIKEKFPGHRIITEETGEIKSDSDYEWLIDPVDGTNNYVFGIPYFAVSIAVTYKDEIILGVIYMPITDMLFTAEKGKGAFVNGGKITVSKTSSLKDAKIILGFHKTQLKKTGKLSNAAEIIKELLEICKDFRRTGAIVPDLSYVALGKFDARLYFGELTPWDTPAGEIIIKEAGGKVTDLDGNEPKTGTMVFVASNGIIHDELLKIIKEGW